MAALNFSPRDVNQAIEAKLRPERRSGGKEINLWYRLDGKRLFRVTTPKTHSGSAVPAGTLNQIVKSLKVSKDQFSDLVRCPLSGTDYETLIRNKIKAGQL